MKELKKWQKQKYAVNVISKIIFEIDAVEVIDDQVIIFGGEHTNSSLNLHTIKEAHYLDFIKSTF